MPTIRTINPARRREENSFHLSGISSNVSCFTTTERRDIWAEKKNNEIGTIKYKDKNKTSKLEIITAKKAGFRTFN